MNLKRSHFLTSAVIFVTLNSGVIAAGLSSVGDDLISAQRAALAKFTDGAGFGPQAPRNIELRQGSNRLTFEAAPDHSDMNLCNIHFHAGAEHKGGEFTRYIGNGDGNGYGSGYAYSGPLSDAELADIDTAIGDKGHGGLMSGDTIEVHYVHTTAQITPGPTLGSCLSESVKNPQLRVETQVYVLVNDKNALDFVKLNEVAFVDGFHQAVNLPNDSGEPVQYSGSTTGPNYNEKGSPFQVSWSVRPKVLKVNIMSVAEWFENNVFAETSAHAVRNLVVNPALLSSIKN